MFSLSVTYYARFSIYNNYTGTIMGTESMKYLLDNYADVYYSEESLIEVIGISIMRCHKTLAAG